MAGVLTTYERLDARRPGLRWRAALPPGIIAACFCFLVYHLASSLAFGFFIAPVLLSAFVVGFAVSAKALEAAWSWYARTVGTLRDVQAEIDTITTRVADFYASVPRRPFGARFKMHYDLRDKKLDEFEKALAVGMRQERKEVWVAAFCQGNTVVRVTAAIGSANRCRPADDVSQWPRIALDLRCTEVRQYHNHPGNTRTTEPSAMDFRTAQIIWRLFSDADIRYGNYIVFWNEISEHRIVEYSEDGTHKLVLVFDGAD